ncbi:TerB family tellurite resistance protein [Sphingopyxis sp. H115]|uniref:TerB family tellurite resistance protein n=1 Tax=Sphingopyxis sp. H115 TaxID=1759073 RepID=UPI0007368614|nr:TerB family tellurite resistance protein [Sphingopyxis sp. H115]KTE10785.1 hypothetical protein ATE71_12335 [Sphingopyxis sp. H115]
MDEQSQGEMLLKQAFSEIECVIADPLRFKLQLGIGEDAYTSLRTTKYLYRVWDTASWAGTGAAVAASKTVATTFFAPTGLAALFGFGAAVTPVGWVLFAAATSAGAFYGVTRLFGGYEESRVDKIPKFINTPIDVLGASLFDLMAGLAVRVAQIDGEIDKREIGAITDYFVGEWGFHPAYVESALAVVRTDIPKASVKDMARSLASFQAQNPDCNNLAMQAALVDFLREIAMADGVIDEREDLAIDAIAHSMKAMPFSRLRLKKWALTNVSKAAGAVTEVVKGRVRKIDIRGVFRRAT